MQPERWPPTVHAPDCQSSWPCRTTPRSRSSTSASCTGPQIHRVPGTIADAGNFLREHGPKDAYDMSTLREPYRIEGKKTMAYELVEQLGGDCAGRRAVSRPVAAPA